MNEVFNYIMGTIIVTSILVNSLALCAFLISPGLRTTAHNLVINLLIVNIVGCTILIFSMFNIASVLTSMNNISINNNNHNYSQHQPQSQQQQQQLQHHQQQDHHNLASIFLNSFSIKNNDVNNNNNNNNSDNNNESANINDYDGDFANTNNNNLFNVDYFTKTTDNKNTKEENAELSEHLLLENNKTKENLIKKTTSTYARFWGCDLSAALGALSVLLIVGDTWFAVTDPLRYHTRISKPKAWLLIGLAWFLSIIFGIASAFRYNSVLNIFAGDPSVPLNWLKETIDSNSTVEQNIYNDSSTSPILITNHHYYKYNTIFSCTYFIIIIMMPICFVSLMYWKIYLAAKDNVVRMRKSGSSSILNTAMHQHHHHHHYSAPASQFLLSRGNNSGGGGGGGVGNGADNNSDDNESSNQASDNGSDGLTFSIDKKHPKINNNKINQNNNNNNNNNINNSRIGGNHQQQKFTLLPSILEHKVTHSKGALKSLLLFENHGGNEHLRQVKSTPNLQNHLKLNLSSSAINQTAVTHPQSSQYNSAPPTYCRTMQHLLSIRHRLSNASSNFKYREEIRTARISIMVIIMFFISYFPYGVLVLLQSDVNVGSKENILLIIFVFVAHLCTPFIFAYRNRSVRRGLMRLFRRASANSNIVFNTSPKLMPTGVTMRRIQSTSTILNHLPHHHHPHRVARPFSR